MATERSSKDETSLRQARHPAARSLRTILTLSVPLLLLGLYLVASNALAVAPVRQADDEAKNRPYATYEINKRVHFDLDVDSNNDGTIDFGSQDEDNMEEASPGKYLLVNDGDADNDRLPDYLDGIWEYRSGHGMENNTESAAFTPMKLTVTNPTLVPDIQCKLNYRASDPSGLTISRHANGTYTTTLPANGTLRVWIEDGTVTRDATLREDPPGTHHLDYLDSGHLFKVSDFGGSIMLYVEGIKKAENAEIELLAEIDGTWKSMDKVVVSVIDVDLSIDGDDDIYDTVGTTADGVANYIPGQEGYLPGNITKKIILDPAKTMFNETKFKTQDMKIVALPIDGTMIDEVTFTLSGATDKPGYCENKSDAAIEGALVDDDFSFSKTADDLTQPGTIAGGKAKVDIYCKDYGGKATITVNFKRAGTQVLSYQMKLPVDMDTYGNGDGVADLYEVQELSKWSTQYGLGWTGDDLYNFGFFYTIANREEKDPDGATGSLSAHATEGDTMTALQEYRGVILDGGGYDGGGNNPHLGGHKRLGFARKEYLIEIDLRSGITPPGGSTADIINDGCKVWSNSTRGCGIWIYYVYDEDNINAATFDANVDPMGDAIDYLKTRRNSDLKKYFAHLLIGEDTPAWGTGSGRGYCFKTDADKDKRGLLMFFKSTPIAPTKGGFMKVFAHEQMHFMYTIITGDFNAGQHLIDPDGDGHLYVPGTGWTGDPNAPPQGADSDDQKALMWQLSHADQEDPNKVTVYQKVQKVIRLKDHYCINP